jgi:hypothetical protein
MSGAWRWMSVASRELLGFESPRGLMPVTIEQWQGGTERGKGLGMRATDRSLFVYFTVYYGTWTENICSSERGGFDLEMDFDVYLQDRNSRVNILVHRKVSVTVIKGIRNRGKIYDSGAQNFQSHSVRIVLIIDNQLLRIQICLFILFIFYIFCWIFVRQHTVG